MKINKMWLVFLLIPTGYFCANPSNNKKNKITIQDRLSEINQVIASRNFASLEESKFDGVQGVYLLRVIRDHTINAELRIYFSTVDQDSFDEIFHKANDAQRQFMISCRYQQFKK